jgi:MFS family permease
MGLTQGLLSAMVADVAPATLRGSAFGLFNLATGVALLVASVMAGALWDAFGPGATFLAGAGFAALAGLGVLARGVASGGRARGVRPRPAPRWWPRTGA